MVNDLEFLTALARLSIGLVLITAGALTVATVTCIFLSSMKTRDES